MIYGRWHSLIRKTQKMGAAKIQQRRPKSLIRKGLPESLPTSVQKSYFLLGATDRDVLNRALDKYRPGRSEPILIGSEKLLKPALKLMRAMTIYSASASNTRKYKRLISSLICPVPSQILGHAAHCVEGAGRSIRRS